MKHANIWLKTILSCVLISPSIASYIPLIQKIKVVSKYIPQELNRHIRFSKKSIRMAHYYLTHPDTIEALIERRAAHVPIELIIDQATLRCKPKNIARLLKKGVTIYVYTKRNGLMHHKLSLLDSYVITGSANASQNCSNNEEHILIIDDEDTYITLEQEFISLKKKCTKLTTANFNQILHSAR